MIPDGQQGATHRSLCALLQIDTTSQAHRIKRNKHLAPGLVLVQVELPDGARTLNVVLSNYIALFVATLHISRLSPAAQETAQVLQTQAVQAIARAFSQPDVGTESSTAFAAPAPETMPVSPAWDRMIAGVEEMLDGLHEVKADYTGLEQRVLVLEQDRLGRRLGSGAKLSAAQIGQLFMQLALLREQTGIPIEDAEKQLAAQFGVAHSIDVDASEWDIVNRAILALFKR